MADTTNPQEITLVSLHNDLHDLIDFLKENMVTKTEFEPLKADVAILKTDVANIYARLDTMQTDIDDIKASLKRLEQRTQQDTDAFVHDMIILKKRVTTLEKELADMRQQQSN